jgi:hypothetical protein
MPSFAVDSPWAAAGHGLGTGIGALFGGEAIRQKAAQDAIGKEASIYMHRMAGDKYRAEASLDQHRLGLQQDPLRTAMIENQVPLDSRPVIEKFMQTGSFGPEYQAPSDGVGPVMPPPVDAAKMSTIARAIALMDKVNATKSNVHQMAQAGEIEQKLRDRAAVIANPEMALPTAQAFFATSGKAPFKNIGNTGMTLEELTGNQFEGNPVLAKIFTDTQAALTGQRNAAASASNASAGLSNARRDRVTSGLDKPVTIVNDETGQASVTALPTKGDPRTIGVAVPKGSGVDSTNAKARNQIIAAAEKEYPGADEATINAEVNKRLARRGMAGGSNKNPAASNTPPKIDAKELPKTKADLKTGSIYQTAKGPAKWNGSAFESVD